MSAEPRGVAVVTGASSGIGAASARRLAGEGFHVVVGARRTERLAEVVEKIEADGGRASALTLDVTDDEGVTSFLQALEALLDWSGESLTVLVNNAGGALGVDPVERADVAGWQAMYDVNVLGTVRVTKALLPALERGAAAFGTSASIVVIGSTAALGVYEGGAGYAAAKHAVRAVTETLRLELNGRPVRVIEIDPGMVATDEFSLKRFGGDAERAAAVYAGVAEPLVAEDIADSVAWTVTRPKHVNIDRIVVRPLAQASNTKVHRTPTA